jgi:hypothetical protein
MDDNTLQLALAVVAGLVTVAGLWFGVKKLKGKKK